MNKQVLVAATSLRRGRATHTRWCWGVGLTIFTVESFADSSHNITL